MAAPVLVHTFLRNKTWAQRQGQQVRGLKRVLTASAGVRLASCPMFASESSSPSRGECNRVGAAGGGAARLEGVVAQADIDVGEQRLPSQATVKLQVACRAGWDRAG